MPELHIPNIKTKKLYSNDSKKEEGKSPNPPINAIATAGFNDYQNQFAFVDDSGSVGIYDLNKGLLSLQKEVPSSIYTCAIEQKNTNLLAIGGMETKISLFEINTKKSLKPTMIKELVGHSGTITGCCFLNDSYLISSSNDSTLILWDIKGKHKILHQFKEHENEINSLDISEEDGNIFISGSTDTTARMWDIRQKSSCIRIFDESRSIINSVKFMPNRAHTVAVAGDDFFIRLYDLRALGKIGVYEDKSNEAVRSLCFSKSGRIIFASFNNQQIKAFDVLKETKLDGFLPIQHMSGVKSLAITVDGRTLLSSGKDGAIYSYTQK